MENRKVYYKNDLLHMNRDGSFFCSADDTYIIIDDINKNPMYINI